MVFISGIGKMLNIRPLDENEAYGFVVSPNGILQFYFLYNKLPLKSFFHHRTKDAVFFTINMSLDNNITSFK